MIIIRGIKYRYKKLKYYTDLVKRFTGKNKMMDIFLSKLFLNVPYRHYFLFYFYKKPWNVRKDYIMDNQLDYSFKYNKGVTADSEIDKSGVVNMTKQFMNRKVIRTDNLSYEDFQNFTDSLTSFFYKPMNGCGGDGIEKFYINKYSSLKELYSKINSYPRGILEETIVQHKDMDKLCPSVLQTIRFLVFRHKDGPKIIFASVRTAINKDAVVDNASAGGAFANINLETGRIQTNAFRSISDFEDIDKYDIDLFTEKGLAAHPITGTVFKGFQIPCFAEAKQLAIDIVENVNFEGRRLLGLDIAISEKGPVLVEANINRPGFDAVWQTACKSIPLKPILDEMLKE